MAERSKAVAQGAIPKGRGLDPPQLSCPPPVLPPPFPPRPSSALPPPAPAPHPWAPCTRLPPCGPIAPPASAPSPLRALALPLQRPPAWGGAGRTGRGAGGVAAAMAQLGERRAPDVKVPSSILSFGIFTPAPLRGVSLGFRFISRQRISKVGSDVFLRLRFRMELRSAVLTQALHMVMGPIPTEGFGFARMEFFRPKQWLGTRTGHQKCVFGTRVGHQNWPPGVCFGPRAGHHNGVLAPETATATALRHPAWSPVRCFGTQGAYQNGGATSELAWEGRLEVQNGRILVKVAISCGGGTSNFGRNTSPQALMQCKPAPFFERGGSPSPNLGARLG